MAILALAGTSTAFNAIAESLSTTPKVHSPVMPANDYPPGSIIFYTDPGIRPDRCNLPFITQTLEYENGRLMTCNRILRPHGFQLVGARSATTITFKEYKEYPQPCNPSDGRDDQRYRFYIELKTTRQPTNNNDMIIINDALRAARVGDVVAPGVRVNYVYRESDIGADFEYHWWLGCIGIKSSD